MLDVDALHALLWLRADARGVLRINQSRLANELCTKRLVIHRTLERMAGDGRISKIPGASGPATRSYEVIDPQAWKTQRSAPK